MKGSYYTVWDAVSGYGTYKRQSKTDSGLGFQVKVLKIVARCPLYAQKWYQKSNVAGGRLLRYIWSK